MFFGNDFFSIKKLEYFVFPGNGVVLFDAIINAKINFLLEFFFKPLYLESSKYEEKYRCIS